MADKREQLFKELAKRLRDEGPDANIDDLIQYGSDNLDNSRQTRDLLDQFVGSEMFKNTSIPIKMDNDKQIIDTLNRLTEQYTDVADPNWSLIEDPKAYGYFNPNTKGLEASKNYIKDPNNGLYVAKGLVAHEPIHQMVNAEGGESVKDNIMNKAKEALMKEKGISARGNQLNKLGALAGHEIMQHGHLNPNSKMTSSLKNALGVASGDFKKVMKGIPVLGPAIAGGITLATTGDVSAATQASLPLVGDADNLGPESNSPESIVEDPTKSYEQRRRAIEMLAQQRGEQ
jgi:hypothetical protein